MLRIFLALISLAPMLQGQDFTSNKALRQQYLDQLSKEQSLYGSAPITHISPDKNNITYALGFSYPNVTITPDTEDPSYYETPGYTSSLELTGWEVAPHLAVSLKNIGLGFSVGRGEKKAFYKYEVPANSAGTNVSQESLLTFGDVGLFAYFVPFSKIFKRVRATVILGGRSINAKHTVGVQQGTGGQQEAEVLRYNVNEVAAGLNVKIKLLKRFALIPWADYRYVDTSSIDATAEDKRGNSTEQSQLQSDIELFWHSYPATRYGIDFSIRIFKLEVNIGGVLGALALSGNGKESIEDNAITINFSFHQKGS